MLALWSIGKFVNVDGAVLLPRKEQVKLKLANFDTQTVSSTSTELTHRPSDKMSTTSHTLPRSPRLVL